MAITITVDIVAVGRIACEACCSVQLVNRATAALGISPSHRINGIDYYPVDRVEEIVDMIRELQHSRSRSGDASGLTDRAENIQ